VAVGGGGFIRRRAALAKGRPDETFPIPVTAAERGSIPFSTTASRTVNMTIIIPTMFFMSSEVSGFSRMGLTLLTRAVAVTRTSFIAEGSRTGLGGGVVGKEIPAEIVRGVDFSLGFRAAALAGRVGSASEKPGIIKVVPNGTVITTPAGNGGASRGGGIIGISISRVINRWRNKVTKRDRFKARHDDVEN